MKASRSERMVVWITSAALGVFVVFCIFWTPGDQTRLFRPIPANAVLVSSHYDLGARLENMATNIFFKSFFAANESALKNLRNNRYAARILASRSILAYVPDFNQFTTRGAWSSSPALVISAWVGGWTPVLRWALWIHPPRDIAPLEDYNGHRLWAYKKPVSFFGAVNYFSFAIDEGIFIGCLSQERNGVVYLLRNYDGKKESILSIPAGNAVRPPAALRAAMWAGSIAGRPQGRFDEKTSAADQVWLRVDWPYATQNKPFFAACSIDALENNYLSATVRFEPGIYHASSVICVNDGLRQNQDRTEAEKLFACSPSIVAFLPSDMAADGLNELISPAWARMLKPILAPSSGPNNVCLLMVFTGAYGGKVGKEPFRIGVPTVLLAVSNSRQEQTKAAVLELLDFINRKHRLGLILNSTLPPVGQYPVFAIEPTSGGLLYSLLPEDQPAFAFFNDWFLLASNSAGLRKLLLNFQSQAIPANDGNNNLKYRNFKVAAGPSVAKAMEDKPEARALPSVTDSNKGRATASPPCRSDLLYQASNRQTKAFIWIDPAEGGQALRFALTASIIMFERGRQGQAQQNRIKVLKAARSWLENISSLKNCAAWMDSENGKTVVRLEIGHKLKKGK